MTLHDNAQRRKRWLKESIEEVKIKWLSSQPEVVRETLKKYV